MNYIDQLQAIQKASGWTQQQLANELGVSFPTLNSWINQRSQPRAKAVGAIAALYIQIAGADTIDAAELATAKRAAHRLFLHPQKLTTGSKALETLTLYLTYHTNTIEGSTMTLADVENVLFDHKVLSNRTAIEQTEARNHQAALYWLLDQINTKSKQFVIDEQLILELHTRLMNGIIGNAGMYRTHGVRIQGTRVALANWQKVPALMEEFVAHLPQKPTDAVAMFARTHAAFEKIHPFSDGNGRTGRLILLSQALQAGLIPPLVVKERKQAYYKYLEAAQVNEHYQPLELFMAQSMDYCHSLLGL